MSGNDGDSRGVMAGRSGFMAEHKPGDPAVYYQRLLKHEERKNAALQEENTGLREEISRLSRRYTDVYLAVKKVFESGASQ